MKTGTDKSTQSVTGKNGKIRRLGIILLWIAVWQAVAWIVHNPIMLVGPVETVKALAQLIVTEDFWRSLGASFVRIAGGFLAGSAVGIVLAWFSCRRKGIEDILAPLVRILKSVPVASFIILALIWFGASGIAFFISFIVVLPILYLNTLEGLHSVDPALAEMAEVFHIPSGSLLKYIEIPAAWPFLTSAFELALGMSWKSGIAAELIGQYRNSIGNHLYMDKIMLDTAGILAWTVVIVLVSWGFEQLFLYLWNKMSPLKA